MLKQMLGVLAASALILPALIIISIGRATASFYKTLSTNHNNAHPVYQGSILWRAIGGIANLSGWTKQQKQTVELLYLAFSKNWMLHNKQKRRPLYAQLRQGVEPEPGTEDHNAVWVCGQNLSLNTTFAELLRESSGAAETESLPLNQCLVEPLTGRETEVMGLLADGLSNREIANELVVVVGTAKAHVYNICQKLGARNRTEAVATARKMNLI